MSDEDDFASMPRDIEAEQAVLGSMLLSTQAIAECLEILGPDDMVRPAHKAIFAAIAAMSARGVDADVITLKAELERRGTLSKVGRADYLHTLIAAVPSAAMAPHYAERVRECAVMWRLAEAGERIRQAALKGGAELAERIDAVYRIIDEAAGIAAPQGARSLADLVGPVLASLEKGPDEIQAVRSGWPDLDHLVPGFRPGEMITVGGRPSHGKSVVMLNIAVRAGVTYGLPVLVCTMEMSAEECIERILACQATVDLRKIRARLLDDSDWDRIAVAHPTLTAAGNLMIDDNPYMSVQSIRSDLRAMARAGHPAELVVVDYLGLMGKQKGKAESREREVSEFSRGLKLLAKEFRVPVIVGSQLNRGPEQRSDHRPLPADLRDSGSVEQDSDIVILLYREDVYEQETARAGEIDLIVAKNRQGALGTATLAFRGHHATCDEMWRPDDDEQQVRGVA
jgi:replicative DNA helicase